MSADGKFSKRQKLAAMLSKELGTAVLPEMLGYPTGHYRTSRFADTARIEGVGISLASFDTITDCVRFGFTVTKGQDNNMSGCLYELHANKPH